MRGGRSQPHVRRAPPGPVGGLGGLVRRAPRRTRVARGSLPWRRPVGVRIRRVRVRVRVSSRGAGLQRGLPLLRLEAVRLHEGREPFALQQVGDHLAPAPRRADHHGEALTSTPHELAQLRLLVSLLGVDDALLDEHVAAARVHRGNTRYVHLHHISPGELGQAALQVGRLDGAAEQRLPLVCRGEALQQQQPAQLWLEAQVEEAVDLEQREDLDPAQHGAPPLDQVHQPTRRRHQQLHACTQLGECLVKRRAAACEGAAQRGAEHELARLAHGGRRRLARRREHYRAQPAALRGQCARVQHEARHDRQQQRGSLAVAAGADDEGVAPGERDGNHVPLQRRGRLVARLLQVLEQLRRELRQVRRLEGRDRHRERQVGALRRGAAGHA
eukprot:scaffold46777_cov60-Phaeocystis_antarctica.AAC.3